MIGRNSIRNISIVLLALLLSTGFVTVVAENVRSVSGNIVLSPESNGKEVFNGNARVMEHKITAFELEALKKLIGVSVEGQNYNQLVDGHGTGLKPPSEEGWNTMGDNLFVVDSIDSSGDKLGSSVSDDESSKIWFPPIGNQDGLGSCVAWSVGYYTKTFQEAFEHNWDLSGATWQGGYSGHPTPSYQNKIASPAFIYNLINGGVDSGSSFYGAIQLVCFVGESTWQTMPYDITNCTVWPSEQAWTEAPLFRGDSTGYQVMYLTTDSALASLKSWISSNHLVTIGVDGNKFANLTTSDLWTTDNYVSPNVNHANTIVGYDDNLAFTENGTTHYGAFKVANSWGVGGWEKVSDGFYWISYEAMKQRIQYCYFYNDLIGYNPNLRATFQINHSIRSECDIQVGVGNPNSPIRTKSFSQYVSGGAHPFCLNNIVFDITEFENYVSNIRGQTFFLRVLDGGTSTTGSIATFKINQQSSNDPPCPTVDQKPVYLTLTFGVDDWWMFHHDLQHTGTSTSKAANTNNTLWSYTTGGTVTSSPAVVSGVVYLGSWDDNVYALNASTGSKIWNFTAGSFLLRSPAVVNGLVYIGSTDHNVYALNASTGSKIWSYATGNNVHSSPAVVGGVVYVGSLDDNVYALNASTGSKIWSYTTGAFVDSSPAVVGGIVYVGSEDNNVYALNASTGSKIWSYTTGGLVQSSPAVVDGEVYIGSDDNKVYCLNAGTGAYIWSYTTGNYVLHSCPAVVDDKVYVGSFDRKVYCLDAASGGLVWSFTTGGAVDSSPAVVDGKVYVGSGDSKVYCLNAATGAYAWSFTTGAAVDSSPAVVDGKVYVGSSDGKLYCFGGLGTRALKELMCWYWKSTTVINSVASGDVDKDGSKEVVTGGYYYDGARNIAQLCVWNGANLALKNVKTWYWTGNTMISTVAIADVDGDGQTEIITGGSYNDGSRDVAQLCEWNGATMALKNVKTWYWTSSTVVSSVAASDVDGDGTVEVVTGGYYHDGTRNIAQLCVWNGATLALENIKTWYWTGDTYIVSIAVGDVDGDGTVEIATGGYYSDGSRAVAQLCVWNGATFALENVQTWFWTSDTVIYSVAIGDVDADGKAEIVTGGGFYDGNRVVAQLCVWNGANLALKNVKTWYWTGDTVINSVALGDVDGDGQTEIVTGGYFNDGARNVAQLIEWNGSNLAVDLLNSWFWTSNTVVNSVGLGDVDTNGLTEVFTGGYYNDGVRNIAQLTVWGMI